MGIEHVDKSRSGESVLSPAVVQPDAVERRELFREGYDAAYQRESSATADELATKAKVAKTLNNSM